MFASFVLVVCFSVPCAVRVPASLWASSLFSSDSWIHEFISCLPCSRHAAWASISCVCVSIPDRVFSQPSPWPLETPSLQGWIKSPAPSLLLSDTFINIPLLFSWGERKGNARGWTRLLPGSRGDDAAEKLSNQRGDDWNNWVSGRNVRVTWLSPVWRLVLLETCLAPSELFSGIKGFVCSERVSKQFFGNLPIAGQWEKKRHAALRLGIQKQPLYLLAVCLYVLCVSKAVSLLKAASGHRDS